MPSDLWTPLKVCCCAPQEHSTASCTWKINNLNLFGSPTSFLSMDCLLEALVLLQLEFLDDQKDPRAPPVCARALPLCIHNALIQPVSSHI